MALTVATWNINSVRLRLPLVLEFIDKFRPDILCLPAAHRLSGHAQLA